MALGDRLPIDDLAQEIRRVDGNHDLGAGALAEKLWPYIEGRLRAANLEGWSEGYDDGRMDAELEYNSGYR